MGIRNKIIILSFVLCVIFSNLKAQNFDSNNYFLPRYKISSPDRTSYFYCSKRDQNIELFKIFSNYNLKRENVSALKSEYIYSNIKKNIKTSNFLSFFKTDRIKQVLHITITDSVQKCYKYDDTYFYQKMSLRSENFYESYTINVHRSFVQIDTMRLLAKLNEKDISSYNYSRNNVIENTQLLYLKPSVVDSDTLYNYNLSFSLFKYKFKTYSFSDDWRIISLLLSVVLIAVIRILFPKYIYNLFISLLNSRFAYTIFKDRNLTLSRISNLMYIVLFNNISLAFAALVKYYDFLPEVSLVIVYFLTLGVFLFFYILYFLIYWLVAYSLNYHKVLRKYFTANRVNAQIFGLLLTIILFPLLFGPEKHQIIFIYILIVLAVISYLLRIIEIFKIFFEKHFSIFYLILYLCTLEFLPIVVVIKLVNSLI